jgi:hypothetical protein
MAAAHLTDCHGQQLTLGVGCKTTWNQNRRNRRSFAQPLWRVIMGRGIFTLAPRRADTPHHRSFADLSSLRWKTGRHPQSARWVEARPEPSSGTHVVRLLIFPRFFYAAPFRAPAVLSEVSPFGDDGDIRVVIETPRGSRSKYCYDPECDCMQLSTVLPEGMDLSL